MKLTVAWTVLLAAGLIPAAVSDARTRSIPDLSNLPVLAAAALRLAFPSGRAERISTLILAGALLLLFTVITLRDFDAMGGGDMKLIFSLTLALGAPGACLMLLLSCAAALFLGRLRRRDRTALAPYLLFGSIVSAVVSFPS